MTRLGALLGFLGGAALAAWLLSSYGVASILGLLARAGWGLVPVVLFHLAQLAASAAGWRAIAGPGPSLRAFIALRWVREGVNNRTRSRMPASIGSNQASLANSAVPSACAFVLFSSMAWSPPALERRKRLIQQARDYATNLFPPPSL